MQLDELVETLLYLQKNGFGKLTVAFESDEGPIKIRDAFVASSSDGVGQYVQLFKRKENNDQDNN